MPERLIAQEFDFKAALKQTSTAQSAARWIALRSTDFFRECYDGFVGPRELSGRSADS